MSRATEFAHQEPIDVDFSFGTLDQLVKEPAILKAAWEAQDPEPVSHVSTTPAEPVAKQRLESFETTDQLWAGTFRQLSEPETKTLTEEDSQETTPPERASPRKEVRRFSGKGSEKLKNKIKKLKSFWKEKQRMMPHLFKVVFREEGSRFELHDLSLKGAAGGRLDDEQQRDDRDAEEEDDLSIRLSDLNEGTMLVE